MIKGIKGFLEGFFSLFKKQEFPSFRELFDHFQRLIEENNRALELMASLGEKLSGEFIFDSRFIEQTTLSLADSVYKMIYHLDAMTPGKYRKLFSVYTSLRKQIEEELKGNVVIPEGKFVLPYSKIDDELEDAVGGKNAHLGIAKNILSLEIPEGFAITTRGFQVVIRESDRWGKIQHLLSRWEGGEISSHEVSERIQSIILSSNIPWELKEEVKKEIERIRHTQTLSSPLYFAVRSSCIGEDSEHSFAGIYKSILGVGEDKIIEGYKEVLASTYSERALEYRRLKGISEWEVAMAVGCQCMIDAKVSGVVYTLDPFHPEKDRLVVAATYGLGEKLVGGRLEGDKFFINRGETPEPSGMEIVRKEKKLIFDPTSRGLVEKEVEKSLRDRPCLKMDEILSVVRASLSLERYFKHPQDVEFAIDNKERLIILQTRPLSIDKKKAQMVCDLDAIRERFKVIFQGKGDVVQEGVAMGEVYVVREDEDLNRVPEGCILVSTFSSPSIARVIKRITGIITDLGSPIGHLATLAREFRIPMLINTKVATATLKNGQKITLNATENAIYDGYLRELCYYEFTEEKFEETREYRLLKRIYKKISPLNLVDPTSRDFVPENCKSLHDIIRFIHEKAVVELIDPSNYREIKKGNGALRIKLPVPLEMKVIELDRTRGEEEKEIEMEEVSSMPLRSFLEGLTNPSAWSNTALPLDMKSLVSSMGKTFRLENTDPRFVGGNLAVVSKDYANISLRMGYHFCMVDTLASSNVIDNYIYFRFFGGMSDDVRRERRAKLISRLLTEQDFLTELKGDLVIGRLKGIPREETLEKIFVLGLVVAYTRQLDVKMKEEGLMRYYLKEFHKILLESQ